MTTRKPPRSSRAKADTTVKLDELRTRGISPWLVRGAVLLAFAAGVGWWWWHRDREPAPVAVAPGFTTTEPMPQPIPPAIPVADDTGCKIGPPVIITRQAAPRPVWQPKPRASAPWAPVDYRGFKG